MQIKRIIGTPGGGKTRRMTTDALKAYDHPAIRQDWKAIGFSSLTKTARREASERLGSKIGIAGERLRKDGWFRTTHSAVFKQLKLSADDMLGDRTSSRQWFEDAFGVNIQAGYDEDGVYEASGDDDIAESLRIWHLARVQFRSIESVRDERYRHGDQVPITRIIKQNIEHYESCKQRTRRLDFDDILAKYAGWKCQPDGTATQCEPSGDPPEGVKFWILDEAQDSSPLLTAAQQRLMSSPEVLWVWLGGDPNQTINEWNGADPQQFLRWPVAGETQLSKSFRCASPILRFAQACLHPADFPGYTQPAVTPADHEGAVVTDYDLHASLESLQPSDDVLVLCRTRQLETKAAAILRHRMVPFHLLRAGNVEPKKCDIARAALLRLTAGKTIHGGHLHAIFQHFPYKRRALQFFTPKAKEKWRHNWNGDTVQLAQLENLGVTPAFVNAIRNESWLHHEPGAADFLAAVARWGEQHVLNPRIRVGTIHSSKGTEADKVVLCTATSRRCHEGVWTSKKIACEEGRVAYVAATRARRKLVLTPDLRSRFTMGLEQNPPGGGGHA